MINVNLLNTADFKLNINTRFVYEFYNQNEAILNDNDIIDNNVNPDSYIEISIESGKEYDNRFRDFLGELNLEELKNLSGKKLTEGDISFFNKLDKFNGLVNVNIDKSDDNFEKINKYFSIDNSDHAKAKRFLKNNVKISVNNSYYEDFLNTNNSKVFFTKSVSNALENFKEIKNIQSQEFRREINSIKIKEDFQVYRKKSSHLSGNSFYFLQVGHFIEKYKVKAESKILCDSRFYFNNRLETKTIVSGSLNDSLNIKDNAVRYGETYFYMVYPVYVTTQPSKDDFHIVNTYILCDYPYITKNITCKEFKRPVPPSKVFFKYNENNKEMKISWSKPLEVQGDVKGYQVFKRFNFNEPFKLVKQIEFHSENDAYEKNENITKEDIEKSSSHKSFFIDRDFDPSKIQIYTICSIDAHGYTSNYSEQLGVIYNFQEKKCMIDLVSRSGAPLHMPNILIPRKTRFFDNDDNIVSITPVERNVKKFTLYLTPEYVNITDDNLTFPNNTLSDNYKLSIYKLENGETVLNNLKIENFR